MSSKKLQIFCFLSILGGLTAIIFTFSEPSETKNALFAGYSLSRWMLGLFIILLTACLTALLIREKQSGGAVSKKINAFLYRGDRAYFVFLLSLSGLFFSLWAFRFSWLFVPKNLRPLLLWFAAIFLTAAVLLFLSFRKMFRSGNVKEKYRLFPRLRDLSGIQKKSLPVLLLLSLIYLLVLLPSNINGTRDAEDFKAYGGDEVVIYPILQAVADPGENYSQWLYHHYIHEDYHYGYPFYAVSYAVLLPFRVILGQDFMQRIDLTVPVLRIMVSVVPLMLGCLILVFLTTRFDHPLLSAAVYLFLLTAPGSLQNNQGFWHPDGLNFFFVCAALYFLQRDRLRLGQNFYICAFFVGLSAATRLFGFFFFLAVFVCLLGAALKNRLPLKTLIRKGLLFLLVMFGTILWSSPFLFRADARQNMTAILTEKTGEMSTGYNADFSDPKNDYRPGWDAWYPAFEDHFTEMYCFFFLIASLITACFIGREPWTFRIIFLWWVVLAVYLIWFVAVKSTQYVLPMMLPLMSCIFALPRALRDIKNKPVVISSRILAAAVFASQLVINIIKIAPRFR